MADEIKDTEKENDKPQEASKKDDISKRKLGIMDKASGFSRGAVLGTIAGLIFAMSTKNKPIVWGLVGLVAGGYIGHRIGEANDTTKQVKFNFNGTKERKRKK